MPHNVTALSACQKMYCVDVGEGANVGRLRAFILRPVGNFRQFEFRLSFATLLKYVNYLLHVCGICGLY